MTEYIYIKENLKRVSLLREHLESETSLSFHMLNYDNNSNEIKILYDGTLTVQQQSDIETLIDNWSDPINVKKHSNIIEYSDDFSTEFNDFSLPHLSYIESLFPGNTFYISSKEDFINLSISYSDNIITLPGNVTYDINSIIDLDGDRLLIDNGESVSFRGSNLSVITSTGLTSSQSLITIEDSTAIFHKIMFNFSDKVLDFSDSTNDKSVYIINTLFENCGIGDIGTASSVGISDSIFRNSNSLTLKNNIADFIIDNCFMSFSDNLINLDNSNMNIFRVTNSLIKSLSNGSVAINIINENNTHNIVDVNQFINFDVYPINGANADTENWHILPKGNIGLPGLFNSNLTLVLRTWTWDGASYALIPETLTIGSADYYEKGGVNIKAKMRASVSHTRNDRRTDIIIYNRTTGEFINESELLTTITTANIYQVVETDWFDLTENSEYSLALRRGTGQGSDEALIRSCTLEIKIF